jgi:tripartite-type tricarboxylate transporter receptor subunit TctC
MKKLLAILLLIPTLALAWEPAKTVTVISGNTPGAGNELSFRKLAEIVQKNNPRFTYVVNNVPGADNVVANNRFTEAAADGYTVNLPGQVNFYVTNEIWQAKIKRYRYDAFIDVLTMGKSPLVLVASSRSTVNSPVDFVRYIHTATRPVNVAVGGGGHRMVFEYLMLHGHGNSDQVRSISFNGPQPAVTSVAQYDGIGGTEFGIMPIAVAKPLIDAGKVKPIGFTGTRRMPQYPNVQLLNTVAPRINVYAAWSLQLPGNTPKPVVDWYQKTFSAAVRSQEYRNWCYQNVIFIEESELDPVGLKRHIEELRTIFLPIAQQMEQDRN